MKKTRLARLTEIQNKSHEELTESDWKLLKSFGIVNGFGPRNNPIIRFFVSKLAPNFKIASADIHDFNYWKGGTEEDKKRADDGFFHYIIADSVEMKGMKFLYYLVLSVLFYLAVRIFGKKYFNYSK